MVDGLASDVRLSRLRATRRRRTLARASVDRAEHAVRIAIGWRRSSAPARPPPWRPSVRFSPRYRSARAAGNSADVRIERHRPLVARRSRRPVALRPRDAAPAGTARRLRPADRGRPRGGAARPVARVCAASASVGRAEQRDEDRRVFMAELFHKRREVSYSPRMAVDPELLEILACPNCKTPVTLVKNGTALKCGTCKRVYPIKDDIPVMLIDEATIEDVDSRECGSSWSACGRLATSSSRRRPSAPSAHHFPDAHISLPRRAGRGGGRRRQSRPRRGHRRAPRAPGSPACAPSLRSIRRLRARAVRPRHRLPRRAARLAAHLAERRAPRVSATRSSAARWMYTTRVARAARTARRATRSRTSGTC